MSRARLGRYLLLQARDFIVDRALAIVITFGLVVMMSYESLGPGGRALIERGGVHAWELAARAIEQPVSFTWFITALMAVHGISANDRTSGRFRLLFAKPVSVAHFYGQAFALYGVLYLVLALLFVASMGAIFPIARVTAVGAFAVLVASYLLVGGVCFLLSALWRFDWGTTIALAGALTYLAAKFRHHPWLNGFPPFWELADQADSLKYLEPLEWRPLVWASAYGVACFLLGLVVLRRRPLAT
ncbi:MAG: hypothetical protein HOQ11_10830 [Gemmatimonadaceae bacterium]|nr:hypothetical protein [Gemmatimonadaceae bacterium]NUQ94562.1 hypothetical protein [Gemmatimonadaceae bacterium]NUR18299.1 hypothetical protein [Gemmatimonadaceae bacterium]NUS97888.1 hypothetical protein [Gemmatimonadaceae bacterium]